MRYSRRLRISFVIVGISVLMAALVTPPAQAAPWYFYKPGHPVNVVSNVLNCTGAWAIRGASGMFFLTAGHCQAQGTTVYGMPSPFGHIRRNDHGRGMDAALVQPSAGVDALQDVVNAAGGVVGHTVGKLANHELQGEMFVNKMGRKTGLTWGQIDYDYYQWSNGERVRCGNYVSDKGDSGGPVFTRDASNRAWAAGMHVGKVELAGGLKLACFITIDDLLTRFGAWLPVFSAAGKLGFVESSPAATPAEHDLVIPVGHIPE